MHYLFLLLILSTSCLHMAKGPSFTDVPAGPNNAILYVYRPFNTSRASSVPLLNVTGVEKFELANAGYKEFALKPNMYSIVIESLDDAPSSRVDLLAEPGKKYFLKYDILADSQSSLAFETIDVAIEEIEKTRLVGTSAKE